MKLRTSTRAALCIFLALTFLLPAVPLASAEGPGPAAMPPLEFAGQVGGNVAAVAVQGNYAYAGVGSRLVVFNVANPAAPVVVGRAAPLPEPLSDVVVAGRYAYVTYGWSGLHIYDVSNPAEPAPLGNCDTPGEAVAVAVASGMAYVAEGNGRSVRVIDVRDPIAPTEIAAYDASVYVYNVAAAGRYVYVLVTQGLRVLDVADPAHPVERGFLFTEGIPHDLVLGNGMAYVGGSGLKIVNVADPNTPALVGSYGSAGQGIIYDVTLQGQRVYALRSGNIACVDVSDPAHPTAAGSYYANFLGNALAAGPAHLYTAIWGDLVVFSTGSALAEVGAHRGSGAATKGVAVSGNRAFVGSDVGRVWVAAGPNPRAMQFTGLYEVADSTVHDVEASGDYLYIRYQIHGLATDEIDIVNVADPAHPTKTGVYVLNDHVNHMKIAGGYAYVTGHGLTIVDVSDPAQPAEAGRYRPGIPLTQFQAADVAGPYAYLVGEGKLSVVDVSDPTQVVEVGSLTLSQPHDVIVHGHYAYVADTSATIAIVDVADPAHPVKVGTYTIPGNYSYQSYDVADDGSLLVLAGELTCIDVSDPALPTVAWVAPGAGGRHLAVAGGVSYVTAMERGLLTFAPPIDYLYDVYLPVAVRKN